MLRDPRTIKASHVRHIPSGDSFAVVDRRLRLLTPIFNFQQKVQGLVLETLGFGVTGSVELAVIGHLRKAKWVNSDSEPWRYGVEGKETVLEASMYPDAVGKDFMEGINPIPVYPLRIIYKVFLEKEILDLVLRETGDGNSSRLGVFSSCHVFYLDDCGKEKYKRIQDWLEDIELQVITII